jgi:hypothetical protein
MQLSVHNLIEELEATEPFAPKRPEYGAALARLCDAIAELRLVPGDADRLISLAWAVSGEGDAAGAHRLLTLATRWQHRQR